MIRVRKKAGRPKGKKLTPQQRMFLAEFEKDPTSGIKAAERAGYAHAEIAFAKLNNIKLFPLVAIEIEKIRSRKEQLTKIDGDTLLQQIQTAALLDCTFWFEPGEDENYWYIEEDNYRELPLLIKRCIVSAKYVTEFVPDEEGVLRSQRTSMLAVQIMDKVHMLALCAKFMLTEHKRMDGVIHQVNWDMLVESGKVNPQARNQTDVQMNQVGNQSASNQAIVQQIPHAIEDKKDDSQSTVDSSCPRIVPQDHVEQMIEEARRASTDPVLKKRIDDLQSNIPSFDPPVGE